MFSDLERNQIRATALIGGDETRRVALRCDTHLVEQRARRIPTEANLQAWANCLRSGSWRLAGGTALETAPNDPSRIELREIEVALFRQDFDARTGRYTAKKAKAVSVPCTASLKHL